MTKPNTSAGLLMCRIQQNVLEYFLVHPGGPFFKNKDEGVWSIPKGIPEGDTEDLLRVAIREFQEETGIKPEGNFAPVGFIKQKAGKIVHAWTFLGEWDPADTLKSNTFSLEWPPRSGKFQDFPEMDKAEWMTYEKAIKKINPAQVEFLNRARQIFLEKLRASR